MFHTGSIMLAFGLFWGSCLLPAIVGLLMPGRKGKMRTTRSIKLQRVTADQTYDWLVSRIEFHGFKLLASQPPYHLKAVNGSAKVFSSPDEVNAAKAMGVEANFIPDDDGVIVELSAWMRDFVLLDTGEGRHVDMVLERLLSEDPEAPLSGPSTNLSYWAFTAIIGGLAGTGLSLLQVLVPELITIPDTIFAHGLGLTGGWVNCAAGVGLWSIYSKGGQIIGSPMAITSLILGTWLILFATVLGA